MEKSLVLSGVLLFVGCVRPPVAEPTHAAPHTIPFAVETVPTSTKTPTWDVDHPPGEPVFATIDTDEGTWMSVDVSPDGRQLVFDLLGDIYVLPIEGGTARALTSGMSWDMHPTFSPDGRSIAFVSDRSGSANLWLMDADGKNPKKLSSVTELSNPTFAPDGAFIAVRRHFTTLRSIGAGEVWLYHRTGGDGLQMTKRTDDQKDVGEPRFSSDGRYVYFSRDVTPGKYFEYNKDPHAGIYAIQRLERASGRIETVVRGMGGGVAPAPSSDGRWLAYVRRHGLRTALFVRDLESGAERLLYDALDRDLQETWAIHGVYPRLAWTPDDQTIVFWAGGKLRRIDVKTKSTKVIPFRVNDKREMRRAVRFPVDVHPEKFRTKMLRYVTLSPDETSVVFNTLGHLWIQKLAAGKRVGAPRRLTSSKDAFEQHPSFSRDGRWIVFTTWSDDQLGAVNIVHAAGGRARVVTNVPGHYANPTFTPNGQHVVYEKIGADVTRSKLHTWAPGLYLVPAAGGEAKLVRRGGGHRPHFGVDADRVFFSSASGEGAQLRYTLMSIELDGSDQRTHVKSPLASEQVVSSDGRYIAIRENYQAYLAPFPPTGRPIELSRKSKALPVVEVSAHAGAHLHFTKGSKTLSWSMGPELFSRRVEDAFGPKPDPIVPIDLSFEVPSDRPTGVVVLSGGRAVTMNGDEVIDDVAVVVTDNRITAIGPRASVKIPDGAKIIDTTGTTIVPGFVDVHHHGPQGGSGIIPQRNWALFAMLAFGVTAVHDPSHHTATIFAASELARAGLIIAPRIFSTGTILYGAGSDIHADIDSLDDATDHLTRLKSVGAFTVKSYRQPKRTQRQQVIAAARALGMMVVPEGGSIFQDNMNMIVDGHTGIEHAVPLAKMYKDVVQLWSQSQTGYTPTLNVAYGGIWGENFWYKESDVFAHPRLTKYVPPYVLVPRSRRRMLASDGDYNHIEVARMAKRLTDAGVSVQLGAHGQREGLAVHWEMWMMVQGGMTPHEALRAATLNGAKYIGLDGDIGSLSVGKLADFAVIEGDVLTDIRRSENVRYTVINGRVYDAATMNAVAPNASEKKPFFFETP